MVSPLNFEDKKKMLFDCLTTAEESIKGTSLEQKKTSRSEHLKRNQPKEVKRFQGKESIFKRPAAPIDKCLRPRRVPDYQMNPHKWKKYSLGDTDISDKTNSSAAFAFLAEIERRKEQNRNSDDDMDADGSDKIVFKSRAKSSGSAALRRQLDDKSDDDDKPILKGSKLVMPEYVIGQKKQTANKRKSSTITETSKREKSQTKPHLQHLFEEDEDDE